MFDELAINGVDGNRICIIPPIPRGLEKIQPLPMPEEANLLFVGQVIRGKGVDLLLQALAKIKVPCTLTIVGDGNHRGECERLASSLGLSDRVSFEGWVDYKSLDHYYTRCQIAVVPSRWPEPFGMVGIEAMARARPVVAFDSGGIADWLQDDLTGLLATPGDTSDLAKKIERLLTSEDLRRFMAQRALRSVHSRYCHKNFIRRLISKAQEVRHEDANFCLRGG